MSYCADLKQRIDYLQKLYTKLQNNYNSIIPNYYPEYQYYIIDNLRKLGDKYVLPLYDKYGGKRGYYEITCIREPSVIFRPYPGFRIEKYYYTYEDDTEFPLPDGLFPYLRKYNSTNPTPAETTAEGISLSWVRDPILEHNGLSAVHTLSQLIKNVKKEYNKKISDFKRNCSMNNQPTNPCPSGNSTAQLPDMTTALQKAFQSMDNIKLAEGKTVVLKNGILIEVEDDEILKIKNRIDYYKKIGSQYQKIIDKLSAINEITIPFDDYINSQNFQTDFNVLQTHIKDNPVNSSYEDMVRASNSNLASLTNTLVGKVFQTANLAESLYNLYKYTNTSGKLANYIGLKDGKQLADYETNPLLPFKDANAYKVSVNTNTIKPIGVPSVIQRTPITWQTNPRNGQVYAQGGNLSKLIGIQLWKDAGSKFNTNSSNLSFKAGSKTYSSLKSYINDLTSLIKAILGNLTTQRQAVVQSIKANGAALDAEIIAEKIYENTKGKDIIDRYIEDLHKKISLKPKYKIDTIIAGRYNISTLDENNISHNTSDITIELSEPVLDLNNSKFLAAALDNDSNQYTIQVEKDEFTGNGTYSCIPLEDQIKLDPDYPNQEMNNGYLTLNVQVTATIVPDNQFRKDIKNLIKATGPFAYFNIIAPALNNMRFNPPTIAFSTPPRGGGLDRNLNFVPEPYEDWAVRIMDRWKQATDSYSVQQDFLAMTSSASVFECFPK